MALMDFKEKEEETSFTETSLTVIENYPRPRALWEERRHGRDQIVALFARFPDFYDELRRLAA